MAERIDQLTLAHPDEKDLRQSREQQASWLKRAMAGTVTYRNRSSGSTWTRGYSWPNGNRTRNATRTIDAENRKARYIHGPPTRWAGAEEIDLNEEEGWACLRDVLTGTRP